MRWGRRKTTPKVRDGKVQRKNRRALTLHYSITRQDRPVVDRQRPGPGYRHLINTKQLYQFIDLLPDWEELSRGLNAVVLAPGERHTLGWHWSGIVAVCAWEVDIQREWENWFINEHREVLHRLGVERQPIFDEQGRVDGGAQRCMFTETSARGFLLMHVLLHELGHHHDRMTSRTQKWPTRGESYAEDYASHYADQIWEAYFEVFGW